MSVTQVVIDVEAYRVCQTHAQTTDKEEIMGLLIGYVSQQTVFVTSCFQLVRSDKRADRVEIHSNQLSLGIGECERLNQQVGVADGKPEYAVVGWYHSHPHITIEPSEVDVRTQAQYELLSRDWVGVIVGVFNRDEHNMARTQMIAFQAPTETAEGDDAALAKRMEGMNDEEATRLEQSRDMDVSSMTARYRRLPLLIASLLPEPVGLNKPFQLVDEVTQEFKNEDATDKETTGSAMLQKVARTSRYCAHVSTLLVSVGAALIGQILHESRVKNTPHIADQYLAQ